MISITSTPPKKPPKKTKNQNTTKNSSLSKIVRTSTVQESMVNEPYISYVDVSSGKGLFFILAVPQAQKNVCMRSRGNMSYTQLWFQLLLYVCRGMYFNIYTQYDYLRNAHRVRKSSMHCRQYMSEDETKTHSPINSAPHIQKRYQSKTSVFSLFRLYKCQRSFKIIFMFVFVVWLICLYI